MGQHFHLLMRLHLHLQLGFLSFRQVPLSNCILKLIADTRQFLLQRLSLIPNLLRHHRLIDYFVVYIDVVYLECALSDPYRATKKVDKGITRSSTASHILTPFLSSHFESRPRSCEHSDGTAFQPPNAEDKQP